MPINHCIFTELRTKFHKVLSVPLSDSQPKITPPYTSERDEFRKLLRKKCFLKPHRNRKISALYDIVYISDTTLSFKTDSFSRLSNLVKSFEQSGKYPTKRKQLQKIPISVSEKLHFEKGVNRTKAELLAMVDENIRQMIQSKRELWLNKCENSKIKKGTKNEII